MTPRRILFLTSSAWALACATLVASAVFNERVHRYDDCNLAFVGSTLAYVCPVGQFRARPPVRADATA